MIPTSEAPLPLKPVRFIGSSRRDLRAMPGTIRHAIGERLMTLQLGGTPADIKPIPTVGAGACEIRTRDAAGAFRAVYVAKFSEAIFVLHVFQKKTRKTAKADLMLARQRYRQISGSKP